MMSLRSPLLNPLSFSHTLARQAWKGREDVSLAVTGAFVSLAITTVMGSAIYPWTSGLPSLRECLPEEMAVLTAVAAPVACQVSMWGRAQLQGRQATPMSSTSKRPVALFATSGAVMGVLVGLVPQLEPRSLALLTEAYHRIGPTVGLVAPVGMDSQYAQIYNEVVGSFVGSALGALMGLKRAGHEKTEDAFIEEVPGQVWPPPPLRPEGIPTPPPPKTLLQRLAGIFK